MSNFSPEQQRRHDWGMIGTLLTVLFTSVTSAVWVGQHGQMIEQLFKGQAEQKIRLDGLDKRQTDSELARASDAHYTALLIEITKLQKDNAQLQKDLTALRDELRRARGH